MSRNVVNVMAGLFVALVFCLTGCGGGTISSPTVSGTASEGALILGKTVTLKDFNGRSVVATTNEATGTYSIDVSGLTAPFLVMVTGAEGTYISFASTAGKANINPITTIVVALAARSVDIPALFTSLTPLQLTDINNHYFDTAQIASASLQAAWPSGTKAEDYFTGNMTPGTGMDVMFDRYLILLTPANGITIQTKDASATNVLTIPSATVTANTNQPLPTIVVPVTPTTGSLNSGMLSGQTFTYSFLMNGNTMAGSVSYKADNTLTRTDSNGTISGTWVINSSGQLVTTFPNEIDTITLISSTSTSFTSTIVWNTNGGGIATMTSTISSTPGTSNLALTTAVLSGKTFAYYFSLNGNTMTGSISYKADNTLTRTDSNGTISGTWVINSSGQLVTTFPNEIDTITLTSSTSTSFTSTIFWNNNGSGSATMTSTISS